MASFPYILFIFIVVFGCCLLIFDYTDDRKEYGIVHENQRITRKKSESNLIYQPWRKTIIRNMKQINKEEKKEEQQLEQQNIKEDLKHKKSKKKKRKQYYQELKEENRKNHEKYADYYKRL